MNRIIIERNIDGYTVKATAHYIPSEDAWECRVRNGAITVEAREGETDAWAALIDMIDLALSVKRQRDALNAGPFSSAQCR